MNFIKSIAVLGIALFVSVGFNDLHAQNSDANVTISKVVDASADDIWTLLRQMDDIDRYSSAIAQVTWTGQHGVGGQRVCTAPDGQGYFKESIVSFDDSNRSYSYALLEGVPTQGMVNSFKVVDLGYQKAMIIWTSNYDAFMENPQMTEEQFLAFIRQSVGEMIDNVANAAQES